jgi:hypothetical protein
LQHPKNHSKILDLNSYTGALIFHQEEEDNFSVKNQFKKNINYPMIAKYLAEPDMREIKDSFSKVSIFPF